jgi:two-component system, cell cycle sensor histidine kinase and response regulator CckA
MFDPQGEDYSTTASRIRVLQMQNATPREVLVVDDELTDLELMCGALRKEGYRVVPASGYLAALNTYGMHAGGFDLLVSAIALPDQNGCELAKKLLTLSPGLQVLFVSAASGAEVCRFYGLLGPGIHFLEKPLKRDAFIRMVRLIIEPTVLVRTKRA